MVGIEVYRHIDDIFKSLIMSKYNSLNKYDHIMKNNLTRLEFLNMIIEEYNSQMLDEETNNIWEKYNDIIFDFIEGNLNKSINVPRKYQNDVLDNLYIPSISEMESLLDILSETSYIFDKNIMSKSLNIRLPQDSFNQYMIRKLQIKKHNLPHILGLTETEIEKDTSKNVLRKHFINNHPDKIKDNLTLSYYGWLCSKEGKDEILSLYSKILNIIDEDKSKFPNSYDKNGNFKSTSRMKYINDIIQKKLNIGYPLIPFSRCFVKTINTINFMNFSNTYEVILDYYDKYKKDNKDIFFVNGNMHNIRESVYRYLGIEESIKYFTKTGYDLNTKSLNMILKKFDFTNDMLEDYINLVTTSKYIDSSSINVSIDKYLNQVLKFSDSKDKLSVHLLGFDTDMMEKSIPLDKDNISKSHLDTSLCVTPSMLAGDYYKKGRSFFLDKIYNRDSIVRISNPTEEIEYEKSFHKKDNIYLNSLMSELIEFETKYYNPNMKRGKK